MIPKNEARPLHLEYKVPSTINGSLTSGERVGEVLVQDHGETVTEVTVVSPIAVDVPTEQVGATRKQQRRSLIQSGESMKQASKTRNRRNRKLSRKRRMEPIASRRKKRRHRNVTRIRG